ncbi:MAG: hypothetical protein ACREL3_02140 [Gemmatimonadales bacterium]
MTDRFSGVARAYACYRPGYPPALFAYLPALVPRHDRAWDGESALAARAGPSLR